MAQCCPCRNTQTIFRIKLWVLSSILCAACTRFVCKPICVYDHFSVLFCQSHDVFILCVHIGWQTTCLWSRVEENQQLLHELINHCDNSTTHVSNGDNVWNTSAYMLQCFLILIIFCCCFYVCMYMKAQFWTWVSAANYQLLTTIFYSHILNRFVCINRIKKQISITF